MLILSGAVLSSETRDGSSVNRCVSVLNRFDSVTSDVGHCFMILTGFLLQMTFKVYLLRFSCGRLRCVVTEGEFFVDYLCDSLDCNQECFPHLSFSLMVT